MGCIRKRNKSYQALIFSLISLFLTACATQKIVPIEYQFREFNAPFGETLSVETGNDLFVRGEYIEGESITITTQVKKLIPGAMAIPFPIIIEPGELSLRGNTSTKWKYFCGDSDKVAASFPGLGSVIRPGDCVGIRVSNDKMQWVVDNSNYNNMRTIYTSRIKGSEQKYYAPKSNGQIIKALDFEKIIFEGFYGGQVYFGWERIRGKSKESRQFTFDFDGTPTLVGIKGQQFRILEVNNVELKYEWVKIKPSN